MTPYMQITDVGAGEYMRLRRKEELGKLRRRFEEEALQAEVRRVALEASSAMEAWTRSTRGR